jgi:hypothetical protein
MTAPPRLLLVALDNWLHPPRLARVLAEAGFAVEACCFGSELLLRTGHVGRRFVLDEVLRQNPQQLMRCAGEVLVAAAPDLVVPIDESSAALTRRLHQTLVGDDRPPARALAALLRRSLGDPAFYDVLPNKHRLTALAASLGLRTPAEVPVADAAAAGAFAAAHGWPVVLKAATGIAGQGVRICDDPAALAAACAALPAPLVAQAHIAGRPCSFTGVAYAGRLLAGMALEALEIWPARTGPSSVVGLLPDETQMRDAAARVVAHAGYVGMISFDFMRDAAGDAWLIECNPRSVPASHLGRLLGADLAGALHEAVTGQPAAPASQAPPPVVAYFPQELVRDPRSRHLHQAWHDVPWDEPKLLAAYFASLDAGRGRPAAT